MLTLTAVATIWTSGEDSGKAKYPEIAHPIDIGRIFASSSFMWVTACLHRYHDPRALGGLMAEGGAGSERREDLMWCCHDG